MHYSISYGNPPDHFVDIELSCAIGRKQSIDLLLPAWRPGRYELANYAMNLRMLRIQGTRYKCLPYKKVSRNRWRVSTKGTTVIKVHYQYYADQPDAGGSLLDRWLLYLNFINCLLYLEDKLESSCTVELKIDREFKIACALPRKGRKLMASSYFHLVDSPLLASKYLKLWQYHQHGIQFNLWFTGVNKLNKHKVLKAFKAFSTEQVKTMVDFPEKEFHFMFHTPETKVYHGVEHASSTLIVIGPASELHKSRYNDFLGVSSHELFHCWNVLKIRPKELMPYDFSREVYFDTGFVAEGVTTYYGDLFLVRSGVYDRKQYFKELNKLCKRHFENEGRHHASLVDSSRDLWVDGYQQGAPNRKVSIYTKGALVSLMLDLTIRLETNHQASLDQVMRTLWKEFGKEAKGYSMNDFRSACELAAGRALNTYFDNFIYGTQSLEYELANLLEVVGCCLKTVPSTQLSKKLFGFQTSVKDGNVVVSKIAEASPAHRKLSLKDRLISVNGKKPKHRLNGFIKGDQRLRLEVLSNGRKRKITLIPKNQQYFTQLRISKMKRVSDQQKSGFYHWLGQPF